MQGITSTLRPDAIRLILWLVLMNLDSKFPAVLKISKACWTRWLRTTWWLSRNGCKASGFTFTVGKSMKGRKISISLDLNKYKTLWHIAFKQATGLEFLHHGPVLFQPFWMCFFRFLFPVQAEFLFFQSCGSDALQSFNVFFHHRVGIGEEGLHPQVTGWMLSHSCQTLKLYILWFEQYKPKNDSSWFWKNHHK